MKVCAKCKFPKELIEFSKQSARKDGLFPWCKLCVSEYQQLPEIKLQRKDYYKEYWKIPENSAKRLESGKRSRAKNPRRFWASVTLSLHREKFTVLISLEELCRLAEQINTCYICDTELDWSSGNKGGKAQVNSPSLDRVGNEKIMTLDNVKISCYRCNNSKRESSLSDFIDYCKRIAEKYKIIV